MRCVGPWSKDKFYYLERYLRAFTVSMHGKWKQLAYIDLFAGPGKARVRTTGEELDASPLLAMKARRPFDYLHLCDTNSACVEALQKRAESHGLPAQVYLYCGDCNSEVDNIALGICSGLNLAFIDPTGLDVEFDTIRRLCSRAKVDLIINMPIGTAILRNLDKWCGPTQTPLDRFLGESVERALLDDLRSRPPGRRCQFVLDRYAAKLHSIGYVINPKAYSDVVVRQTSTRAPLYHLVFASKHERGGDLWSKIGQIEPGGQRALGFREDSQPYGGDGE